MPTLEKCQSQVVDTFPLSPMQQGMLFHHALDPHGGFDLEQVVCSFHEDLNIPAFRTAWDRVVARHAVLRTSFRWEKVSEPLQDVHREVAIPFIERDWMGFSKAEQGRELARYLATDRRLGFDLSKAPNLRVMVAKLAEREFKCVWTFHHILLDGRSFPLVLNEVLTIYQALCRREDLKLAAPRPFRDYIDWLQHQDWTRSEAFWRENLKGFTAATALRTIRPDANCNVQASPRGEQETKLSESLTSSLKTFASESGVTLNSIVQGAWAILLSRYSGEEDIVFGTTRACRKSSVSAADAMVGIFINTLPLRVNVTHGKRLSSWLKELRGLEFDLRKHEHTPLLKIQQWSQIQGGKTLFDSLLMFDHSQLGTMMQHSGSLNQNREFELKEQVNYPLVLQAYGEDRLLLRIEYCRCVFDDTTVSRMLGHLQSLLAGFITGAEKTIGSLCLLTEPEKQELLLSRDDAQIQSSSNQCIHELFEQQVARAPEAVAVICDGQSLTYRQLNAQANRLARELRRLGVGPDTLVGICMERSNELVVGLLAILKAGGAYLPIDLAYPAERLVFMLSDAQAPVLITQSALAKNLPPTAARILCMDDLLAQTPATSEEENLPAVAGPDHLAYVIYTSGTTGKPKGSMITHRNVTRLFSATDHWYGFNEKDVWTLFHSYAFDFSVWEIWGALFYGGRVVVVPFKVSRSPEAFYELLSKERVTVLNQTPSAFRQLIQAEEAVGQKPLCLRYVIFGGEALEMQSLQPWFERHGDQQPKLVNMYGITETTVHVTYRPLSRGDVRSGSVIGGPIPDLKVYILDPERQPVPIGIPGEMYVAGAGLARGYLHRSELTSERFIVDHLSGESGSRLYKTGDLARFLPGRDIEYLGRIDNQVKIRGFRVELGEIETILCQHPLVRETIVLAREDTLGDKRLVAYLVAGVTTPSIKELREHLKKKMPEYMVPSAFVFLKKFPLTNNGKIDTKALPKPDQDRPDLETEYVAPRSTTEKEVCRIWTEVLGVKQISANDDFFDLGGHSLMTLRAVSLINDRFKSDLSPSVMFEHRTVAGLSTLLKSRDSEEPVVLPSRIAGNGEHLTGAQADLDRVTSVIARSRTQRSSGDAQAAYRMRESWVCKYVLAPLYGLGGGRIRSLIQLLILKLENDEFFSVTLRALYAKHHNLHIGPYSCGCFDVNRMRSGTRIGAYTSISPTVVIQNANHPRNTISTNALFYHSAFGFAEGSQLPRAEVQIGNDVFIGHNAMIMYPTTKIGDGAVIAAGSAVVEDVPPFAIVGGYPAKVLRYRFSKEKIQELEKSRWWKASLEELEAVKDQFAKPLEGDQIR